MASAVSTASGQPASRSARVRPVRSGTGRSSTARCHSPVRASTAPSGAMMALSPVVEAYTIARSDVIAWIRAMATCWADSPDWPSTSNVASFDWTASRLAPAVTSDRTSPSKPTS